MKILKYKSNIGLFLDLVAYTLTYTWYDHLQYKIVIHTIESNYLNWTSLYWDE